MLNKYALFKVIKGIIRKSEEFGLREIARKIKIAPSTSKEMLDFLMSQDIVERRIVGKNYFLKVKQSFLTKQIRILLSLSEISSSSLINELTKNREIISIIVYGSVAKGIDDDKSDIDLMVISRKKINIPPLKSEDLLNREVTIINYTHNEWKDKAEKDKVFYDNVILNCINLYGEKPVVV